MRQISYKKIFFAVSAFLMAVLLSVAGIRYYTKANLGIVELESINYNDMTLTLNMNENEKVYYSTNRTKWYEIEEGVTQGEGDTGKKILYDISWVSAASSKKLYFRGTNKTTILTVTLPKYNSKFKVKFSKVDGTFDFQNTEDAEIVRWRKSTDYTWKYVGLNDNASTDPTVKTKYGLEGITIATQGALQAEVANFRVKSTKLIFQTVGKSGDKSDEGMRASKEVKVSIPAKRAAPAVKVNVKKLTVNTKATQEYTTKNPLTATKNDWSSCSKNMKVEEVAPSTVAKANSADVTVYFRLAATSSNCESKVTAIDIPSREAAPATPAALNQTAGKKEGKGKAELTFQGVPTQGYDYCIVKAGAGAMADETTAKWKTVKKAKTIKFSESSLPAGSIIYIREAGITANANKKIELKLPSQCISMTVGAYPAPEAAS